MKMHINAAILALCWFCTTLLGTNALYEDQIKKFDWRSLQIGALKHAQLELNSFQPRLLVSTQEQVIASLCPKTGELLWRQVLETGARGNIKLLHATSNRGDSSNTAAARSGALLQGFDLLTVQGSSPALIRGWNANTGTIEWEWTLATLQPEHAEAALWLYADSVLYHIVPVWQSHLEVTQYFASSGQVLGNSQQLTTPWLKAEQCLLAGSYFACLDGQELLSIDLIANSATVKVLRKRLSSVPQQKPTALEGANGILVIDGKLVSVTEDIKVCSQYEASSFAKGQYNQRQVIAHAQVEGEILKIQAHYASSCEIVPELTQLLPYKESYYGLPTLKTFDCKAKRNNDGKSCLFLLHTADEAILTVQQSKTRWVREEALANVVATEFIDLPLADTEGTLEKEMKGKAGDLASALMRRISTQIMQMKSIFLHVLGLGPPPSDTQKAGLVRDAFGLHKMLVVLTRCGKIFGIDNINGKQHWRHYLPNVGGFGNDESMRLIVQRTSKHFPLQPLCTIVARDKVSKNDFLYRFDPITGEAAEGGLLRLNYVIKQLAVLAESTGDFVKGLLIMNAQNEVRVYPQHAEEMAIGMYIYTADKSSTIVEGYYIQGKNKPNNQLRVLPVWNASFKGHNEQHEIINIAGKNPIEHVHSQGRVLNDRSVLYKYNNPNLVAIVTQGPDNIYKYVLNIYLLDVVSGSVAFSMTHRRARGPVQIVHSENWLAYSFYNEKVRRTEISTIELYEGKTQANSTIWSSLHAPQMPQVERQTYIIPANVETMRETITERGITNKDVLIGISSGAIVEMPWALLDPRRPITTSTQSREEGAIPYIPELPLPTENIINYNQTVARLRRIYTAPSGLESTCLVVATGLDMFVTRVAPSKTFDLLKEDFDYMLISVVLVALTSGSLIVKHLASKKLIKQAWK